MRARAVFAAILIVIAIRCVPGQLGIVDVGAVIPPMALKSTPEAGYEYSSPTPTFTATPSPTPTPTPGPPTPGPGEPVPLAPLPPVPESKPGRDIDHQVPYRRGG